MVEEVKDTTAEPVETAITPVVAPVETAPLEAAPVKAVAEPETASEASPDEAVIAAVPAPEKKKAGRPRKDATKAETSPVKAPAAVEAAPVVTETPKAKAPKARAPKVSPSVATAAKIVPAKAKPVKTSRPTKSAALKPNLVAATPVSSPVNKIRVTPATASFPRSALASRKEHFTMAITTNEITEKFQSAMKDAADKAKTAFEKSQASFGDMGEFTKGNVEAIVASGKILATGLQEMGKAYVTDGKSAMETMTAEIKELAAVKSPAEFFEKQTALLRKQFDAAVAASSKNSEAVLKLANEAFQPISNRVSLAVEKMKQAA